MNKLFIFLRSHPAALFFISIMVFGAILCADRSLRAEAAQSNPSQSEANLIADFRRVEVASVSDAIEQLTAAENPLRVAHEEMQ